MKQNFQYELHRLMPFLLEFYAVAVLNIFESEKIQCIYIYYTCLNTFSDDK